MDRRRYHLSGRDRTWLISSATEGAGATFPTSRSRRRTLECDLVRGGWKRRDVRGEHRNFRRTCQVECCRHCIAWAATEEATLVPLERTGDLGAAMIR